MSALTKKSSNNKIKAPPKTTENNVSVGGQSVQELVAYAFKMREQVNHDPQIVVLSSLTSLYLL
jgi:hypothetical protein